MTYPYNGTRLLHTILLWNLLFTGLVFAGPAEEGAFLAPRKGTTISESDRIRFQVNLKIDKLDPAQHYWVAIATVTADENDWERLLDLYAPDRDAGEHMLKLLKSWRISEFWPKFSVKQTPKRGIVHDGGTNPLAGEEPQPMMLLLFKADDQLHKRIKKWFREGIKSRSYPGFPGHILSEAMILDRCEIFFY